MQLKERTVHALGELNSTELSYIYETIQMVKQNRRHQPAAHSDFYLQAQAALASCSGSIAQDIITERGDRI